MKENRSKESAIGFLVAAVIIIGGFGSVLGLESNLSPLTNDRIKDTSFRAYLDGMKKRDGKGMLSSALAVWTYPGARVGAAIHNYGLPEE